MAQIRTYDAERAPGEKHNTLIFCIVNSVDEALRATNDWGVDVLVVQGKCYILTPPSFRPIMYIGRN